RQETAPRVTNLSAEVEQRPARASVATIITAPAPPPNSVPGLAQAGEQYLARLGGRDLAEHEVLPQLRRALNEARDGAPTGARADAIRGTVLFMVQRDLQQAEAAFRSALVED